MKNEHSKTISKVGSLKIDRLTIKIKNKYHFLPYYDIKYLLSSSHYAEIYILNNEKYVYRISMNDLIKKLDSNLFLRVNRSTIVNTLYVKELISEGLGDYTISMEDKTFFSLSKKYRENFLLKLGVNF
jgi:two-component system LytT family response regulator